MFTTLQLTPSLPMLLSFVLNAPKAIYARGAWSAWYLFVHAPILLYALELSAPTYYGFPQIIRHAKSTSRPTGPKEEMTCTFPVKAILRQ